MKGLLVVFLLLICVFCAKDGFAQSYKQNEVSLSYGVAPTSSLLSSLKDEFAFGDRVSLSTCGSVNMDFTHFVSRCWGLGLNVSYSKSIGKFEDGNRVKSTYVAFMPTLKANWFRKRALTLYSKVAVGILFDLATELRKAHNENNDYSGRVVCGFQISPIAIEVGNKFSVFAEYGFGQAGLLQFGFRYKF